MNEQFPQGAFPTDSLSSEKNQNYNTELELKKMKNDAQGDVEVFQYFINKKIGELIESKKRGEITLDELREQRKIFDAQIPYEDFSAFKQQELLSTFSFDGSKEERDTILSFVVGKESISEKGSNQQGVFELPNNRIVKLVSKGNYPYELPMVKLTARLEGKNVIKTYDVFQDENFVYVVQDKAIGKEVHTYTAEELDAIPQEQYDALVQLINMYANRGIATDPSKISNLFYDPEKGFTIIDLGAVTYQRGLDYHIQGYFTNNLSKEKIQKAIEKYGEYILKPILPTLQDKLEKLSLF